MKKTVLCIDDEGCLLLDLSEFLVESGYDVLSASNGREGLERVAAKRPDLIITDISMPIMDGYALLKALREKQPDGPHIPVMVMSASDMTEVVAKCPIRPEAVILKPVDYDDLGRALENMFQLG